MNNGGAVEMPRGRGVSEPRTRTEEGAVTWCAVSFTNGREAWAPVRSLHTEPVPGIRCCGSNAAPDLVALTLQQWDRPYVCSANDHLITGT